MKKAKMLIAGLLVLSVMVVFAGTASAVSSIERAPNSISIANTETGVFTVTVVPSETTDQGDVSAMLDPFEGTFDIVIKDEDGDPIASGAGGGQVTASFISYIAGQPSVFYVDVANNGAPDGHYDIGFTANDGTRRNGPDGEIWAGVESGIPEFTTIAVPVVAILGLVLFFNHRKHKKE